MPPRYIIGFSTGHVGTTSLSTRGMYECKCEVRAHCKCLLSKYGFFHEAGQRKGLQSTHASLCEWHESPLSEGSSLTAREAELVTQTYLPAWNRHEHAMVLSHDTLYYYKGILAVIPVEQLLFIRIRRARDEFIHSFAAYDVMSRDWYPLEPSYHESASPRPLPEVWAPMPMPEKAAWFDDEVERRWQQIKSEHPDLPVLEVEWSKRELGSFEAMAASIASGAGLSLNVDGTTVHKKPASRKQHS